MSVRSASTSMGFACVVFTLAVGASGCLSDDSSLTPPLKDAGFSFDTGVPVYDASGSVPNPADDALPS